MRIKREFSILDQNFFIFKFFYYQFDMCTDQNGDILGVIHRYAQTNIVLVRLLLICHLIPMSTAFANPYSYSLNKLE